MSKNNCLSIWSKANSSKTRICRLGQGDMQVELQGVEHDCVIVQLDESKYNESSSTTKWDKYGFMLVDFFSLIIFLDQSFVFPLHVEQVFF